MATKKRRSFAKKPPPRQAPWLDELDRVLEDAVRPTEGLALAQGILRDFAARFSVWLNQGLTRRAMVDVRVGYPPDEYGLTHHVRVRVAQPARFKGGTKEVKETILLTAYVTLEGGTAITFLAGAHATPHVPHTALAQSLLDLCRTPLFRHRISGLRAHLGATQPAKPRLLRPTARGSRHTAREIQAAVDKASSK